MKVADTRRFVLDASVAVAWCFADQNTKFTAAILDRISDGAEAVVPSVWPLEVANALLVAERRSRIAIARTTALLQRIGMLPISLISIDAKYAFEHILPLARYQGLSQYDAAYLDLALRHSLPLATLDEALRRSAKLAGISLLD